MASCDKICTMKSGVVFAYHPVRRGRPPRSCGTGTVLGFHMKRDRHFQFRARPNELTDLFYCRCQDK